MTWVASSHVAANVLKKNNILFQLQIMLHMFLKMLIDLEIMICY